MSSQIEIVDFDWSSDIDFALESFKAIHDEFYSEFPLQEEKFIGDLRKAFDFEPKGLKILNAEGKRAGFIFMRSFPDAPLPYGQINQLYVLPKARKKGIATFALRHAEKYFKEKNLKLLRLTVSVKNALALELYEAEGYKSEELKLAKKL